MSNETIETEVPSTPEEKSIMVVDIATAGISIATLVVMFITHIQGYGDFFMPFFSAVWAGVFIARYSISKTPASRALYLGVALMISLLAVITAILQFAH